MEDLFEYKDKTLVISRKKIKEREAKAIANELNNNKNITTLEFINNNICNDGAIIIANALKTNTSLTTLEFFNNSIKTVGMNVFMNALNNSHISSFIFDYFSGKTKKIKAVTNMLKTNTTLQSLFLRNGWLDARYKEIDPLSEALKVNTTLKRLDIPYIIGRNTKGIRVLSEALKVNTSLKYIDIGSNKKISEGFLIDALKVNTQITTLTLFNPSEEIKNLLKRNKRIELTMILGLVRKRKIAEKDKVWKNTPRWILAKIINESI